MKHIFICTYKNNTVFKRKKPGMAARIKRRMRESDLKNLNLEHLLIGNGTIIAVFDFKDQKQYSAQYDAFVAAKSAERLSLKTTVRISEKS
jgi:hypothetical protein